MPAISKTRVTEGVHYVTVPEADLHILCGCPADSVKHLMKRGLIQEREAEGVRFETGPNAILLADTPLQSGRFANLAEFPILHMFYRQGRIVPGHPNNTGVKPLVVGSRRQVEAQMEYVFRGNYGLVSEGELLAAGVEPELARDMMRLKLRFAFGRIRRMEEYLDLVPLGNGRRELRGGVGVKRMRPDVFDIFYKGESVRVDLRLPPRTQPPPPYELGHHDAIRRADFAVLHSGEGDGWDPNRPAMASILLFRGKIYLIDAGPNIMHSLNALGIGVNEIAGVFHTHAHDDHFCGLPDLMRADHRIPYYATRFVRASVTKKLAALSRLSEDEFEHAFEYHDLTLGEWNDIDALEVKPVFSPHPVETTVLFFRALGRDGYRTYAHFADIASLRLLRGMITDDGEPGLSRALYEQVERDYLAPVDLKKIDIGGGMIHGDVEDFAHDQSKKIVLAHTALPLTDRQREIGSGAPFGTMDTLIPAHGEHLRTQAFQTLAAYFPSAPPASLHALPPSPMDGFPPDAIILKAGRKARSVHLLLAGQVEMLRANGGVLATLSSGALIGETTALTGRASARTYRAAGFVQALRIPVDQYRAFIEGNGLLEVMTRQLDVCEFLQTNALFGDGLSRARQNAIASALTIREYSPGDDIGPNGVPGLCLVRAGRVDLFLGSRPVMCLGPGDFFSEGIVLFGATCPYTARASDAREAVIYHIPAQVLADAPIIRWKLLETHETRLAKAVRVATRGGPLAWREEYATGCARMDAEHRALFAGLARLDHAPRGGIAAAIETLLDGLERHSQTEGELMEELGYPDGEVHRRRHAQLLAAVRDLCDDAGPKRGARGKRASAFLKERLLEHVLADDRRLGAFWLLRQARRPSSPRE